MIRATAFEKRFIDHCRDRRYFPDGAAVLLAVSGGMDSTVMFHLFNNVKRELAVAIGVIHVNHGLRGNESDEDAAFVRSLADTLGVPCFIDCADVRSLAFANKESIESAARRVRYGFLESCAAANQYDYICTAHHRDDQAETVLARIIRGAGWTGLYGIRERRGKLIRPMLMFSREELEAYAVGNQIPYRRDSTNEDESIFRNRIRHSLLPDLKSRYDPQVARHLNQLSVIAGETMEWIEEEIRKIWPDVCCFADTDKIKLDIVRFNHYLFFQRKMLIQRAFTEILNKEPLSLNFHDYESILRLADQSESGAEYPAGLITVLKTQTRLIIYKADSKTQDEFCYLIEKPGRYEWIGRGIRFFLEPQSPGIRPQMGVSGNVEFIDRKKIQGKLILRNWKPGDRFQPLGMTNVKKLSDFFTDMKIDIWNKSCIPLLIDKQDEIENIIWVCGWRLDDRYKIDESTQEVYKIECHYHEK